MPIIQPDPWRKPFFANIDCPDNVLIPTKDPEAYKWNPRYNWAYNKLIVAEKQNLPCGPHGVMPDFYPVFSKPIYNLRSMGAGIEIIVDHEQYMNSLKPGYMWVQLLTGDHYSTDVAVVEGRVVWSSHTKGLPLEGGTFDYWELQKNISLDDALIPFVEQHFTNYTGMLNLETIGGKIIEMHLRFADQWPDLYGDWFVESLVELYGYKHFTVGETNEKGYSVPLFKKPKKYKKPEKKYIAELLKSEGITSIQLPFHENVSPSSHSMPPGGFRVAIINGFNLESCKEIRKQLDIIIQNCNP